MWSRSAQLCKEFFGSVLTRKLGKGTKIFLSLVIIFYSIISVVMVALWNRANHYIFILFLLLSSFFFLLSLWPPYVIGGPLYFCPVISIFYLSSIFFFLA